MFLLVWWLVPDLGFGMGEPVSLCFEFSGWFSYCGFCG